MRTLQGTMHLSQHYPRRQNALMMHSCGSQQLRKRFTKPRNGLTSVPTLNPSKFRSSKDEVEFAGFEITRTEVKPHRKYLNAIKDFPTPKGITDIRAWFGLVNQVAYTFAMTPVMSELLKPTSPFRWTSELQSTFDVSKTELCNRIREGFQIFEKNRPTCLATDWSKDGIGYTGYSRSTAEVCRLTYGYPWHVETISLRLALQQVLLITENPY